jgi:hypothetical protein
MDTKIHNTFTSFDFNNLALTPPTVLSGGNYFIRYLMNDTPLYVQPPKCKTKGGVIKSGKRHYTDLLFTNENSEFIQWMEDLEAHTCKYIYNNRERWFETDMELSDIENYFASPLKIYKSGKFYLTRTNISTRLGKMTLKIYNEDEEEVESDMINENTEVVTIIEVQGIKCSARSFQIEMEVKQMMTVSPKELLFEKCLLGKKKVDQVGETMKNTCLEETVIVDTPPLEEPTPPLEETELSQDLKSTTLPLEETELSQGLESTTPSLDENVNMKVPLEQPLEKRDMDNNEIKQEEILIFKGLEEPPIGLDELEFDLTLDKVSENDIVQIKQRNDVYYDKYREARKKARVARKLALDAYLEAKHIKQTYMLDEESGDSEDEAFFGVQKNESIEDGVGIGI